MMVVVVIVSGHAMTSCCSSFRRQPKCKGAILARRQDDRNTLD
jgi:hypothetical protein